MISLRLAALFLSLLIVPFAVAAAAASTGSRPALREYDVLRRLRPEVLAAVSKEDTPDADGLTGSNHLSRRWLEAGPQRGACRGVIAAVVRGDLAAADDCWRGIEVAFAHQLPDGGFSAEIRPNGESARARPDAVTTAFFFLQELGRAILVIRQSPHEAHFRARITALEPKLRRAADYLVAGYDTIIPEHGRAVNRVVIAAKAFGTCGLVLRDESMVEQSRRLIRHALTLRDADGVFIEEGGRDSSYNIVSILFGQVLALHVPLPEFEAALPAAVAWQLTRIKADGDVDVRGNTRTGVGKEQSYTGTPKIVNYKEVILGLALYGLVRGDPAAIAAADRVYEFEYRRKAGGKP